MLLTESDVARKVRAYLLNAEALTRSLGHDTAPVPGEGRGCIIGVVRNHLGEGYPMSDVTVFTHESFGQVRHVMIDGEPWFIASDVCTVLDISQTHRALASLDDDEKGRHSMTTPGGVQQVSIVNESGLYSLILRSRKPHAKAFKKWVTSEVLPAIRKTGRYEAKQLDEIEVAERYLAALKAKRALEQANAKLSEELSIAAPKVDKWERFMNSDGLIGMSELGGVLGMSAVALTKRLVEKEIFRDLVRDGKKARTPRAKYLHNGMFEVKVEVINGAPRHVNYARPSGADHVMDIFQSPLARHEPQ